MLLWLPLAAAADLAGVIGELRGLGDDDYTRRAELLASLPPGPIVRALVEAPPDALRSLPVPVVPEDVVATLAAYEVPVNPYLSALDGLPTPWRSVLRRVQPAVARVVSGHEGGTGVNLSAAGLVLTADHVLGAEAPWVELPDGVRFAGEVVRRDPVRDLALVRLVDAVALPHAVLAPDAPEIGDEIVIIGHPGRREQPPFRVIQGHILAFRFLRDGPQMLGATAHDAPTDWGHSGSPLFDIAGRIVGLHNSWNPESGVRHAVSWEAIRAFCGDAGCGQPAR